MAAASSSGSDVCADETRSGPGYLIPMRCFGFGCDAASLGQYWRRLHAGTGRNRRCISHLPSHMPICRESHRLAPSHMPFEPNPMPPYQPCSCTSSETLCMRAKDIPASRSSKTAIVWWGKPSPPQALRRHKRVILFLHRPITVFSTWRNRGRRTRRVCSLAECS